MIGLLQFDGITAMLVGLGTYNAVAPHITDRTGKGPTMHQQTIDAPD